MPFTVPVPAGEPDVAVPASGAGEAAEILALFAGLLAASRKPAPRPPGSWRPGAPARCPPWNGWPWVPAGWPASWTPHCRMRASPATACWTVTGGGRDCRQ